MREPLRPTPLNPDIAAAKQRFGIVGTSPQLLEAMERAIRVAPFDLSVLVTGESGSGKESFPKIIHAFGARKHKKYIAVNCGAIPEGTIDSELFGHEKGSFTGAISDRKGYFEEANGGTIFLDEVAELPLPTQARLLRVLETGEFLKVGSSKVERTDVRIVAATNVDLNKAVAQGRFREDLYYRLSTIIIEVPNLHDRGDDVVLLARKFASEFAERYMTAPISFSEDARTLMQLYRWPGNVRQLKNVVEQLAIFHAGSEIERATMMDAIPALAADHGELLRVEPLTPSYESEREMLWQTIVSLRREIDELKQQLSTQPLSPSARLADIPAARSLIRYEQPAPEPPAQTLQDSERELIAAALDRNGGSRRRAAAELKISERTLYRKIREYDLTKYLNH